MAEGISTFSFENEEIKGGMYEKYKGVKGEIHRLGIVYTDPKAMFAGAKIHFKDRYFLCKKGKCCEVLGPSKWRVSAIVVKYGTDKQGTIKKPFSYELFPWIFSETTYSKLKAVNSEFPLTTHDIKISCENNDFQHLNITPCSEAVWTAKDELRELVLSGAKPMWESMKKSIASDLSVEEINDLIGHGNSATTSNDPSVSGIDLDSVLNKI